MCPRVVLMVQSFLKVHSENILPIIKKWLYTDREIFIRELVSNSCDAINKLKILREQSKLSFSDDQLRIDIESDKHAKTLKVADVGVGMTHEEVDKYISQLAFSGAEEFVKKYKTEGSQDEMIGHFGLGFYSSFMVSDRVEIDTLSFRNEAKSAHWSCDGSSQYALTNGVRKERGTVVTLHIAPDAEEFLEEPHLKTLLIKHCRFLPYPIYLNGKQINDVQPLWIKSPSECVDKDYLDFFKALYPFNPDPIFWIHLNVDYPFHLKGILYFPKLTHRLDPKQSSIHLYCNRVFVSDNCRDIIPEYLAALQGVIDSPDIPLNVSRSNLQKDKSMRQLSNHISKKVSDKISSTYRSDRDSFIKMWENIEPIIKLGALQDDKFCERIKGCVIWKNSHDEWSSLEEYLERNEDKRVFYHHADKQTPFFDMYKDAGKEILLFSSPLDVPLITPLERHFPGTKFLRLDSSIDSSILDESRAQELLDHSGKTQAARLADFFRLHLGNKVEVTAKSLSNDSLPAFVQFSEEERRMRDCLSLYGQEASQIGKKCTLVLNTNNPLVQSIPKLKDPKLTATIVKHLYDLSLLAQKELESEKFPNFLKNSVHLLESLILRVVSA